jgi:hypothetical protein
MVIDGVSRPEYRIHPERGVGKAFLSLRTVSPMSQNLNHWKDFHN